MSTARPRKKDAGLQPEELDASILGKLVEEQALRSAEEEFSNDVTILFCGPKRSGKTSLIDRFINPTKDEKDPKPTVALDYKFARYASDTSTSKVLAHIYDLGGEDGSIDSLASVPVSKATAGNLVVALTLDLAEPHSLLSSLERWLKLLQVHVSKSLDALSKESNAGAAHVQALQRSRAQLFEEHADRAVVNPFPVPLVIFATRWDVFVEQCDPEKRKNLCKALRHFAHVNGASLVMSSLASKDKASLNNVRNFMRQLLFGVSAKGGLALEVEASKPISVFSSKDNIQNIGPPPGGQAGDKAWRDLCSAIFPDPQPAQRGGKKTEADQVGEELLKYTESSIDGMVEQRSDELQQYRKQVERNQRLASEGVDGSKLGSLTT